jgi:hypothetical protein
MVLDHLPCGSAAMASSTAAFERVQDVLGEHVEVVEAELLHHLDEALAADVVAGGERIDVALGVDRQARVGADHRHQRLVELARSASFSSGM